MKGRERLSRQIFISLPDKGMGFECRVKYAGLFSRRWLVPMVGDKTDQKETATNVNANRDLGARRRPSILGLS
jgi:hypothetical protein